MHKGAISNRILVNQAGPLGCWQAFVICVLSECCPWLFYWLRGMSESASVLWQLQLHRLCRPAMGHLSCLSRFTPTCGLVHSCLTKPLSLVVHIYYIHLNSDSLRTTALTIFIGSLQTIWYTSSARFNISRGIASQQNSSRTLQAFEQNF